MKQLQHCIRIIISISVFLAVISTANSQSNDIRETKDIDAFIAKKEFIKADSALNKNIEDLKAQGYYEEITKRIYYYGKIALQLNDKATAIEKTKTFANSIDNITDSLNVKRQKHIVLARFYVYLKDIKSATNETLKALEVTKKMPNATGKTQFHWVAGSDVSGKHGKKFTIICCKPCRTVRAVVTHQQEHR